MKYESRKQDTFDLHFHDDEEITHQRRKPLSRVSAYEIAKRSVTSKLVEGFGIQPHNVIKNFTSSDRPNFIEDQELNPTTFTEQTLTP
ncbi:hypothetical protein PISMIDRAFT_11760 [Pisolithus microcarpus 441]|uniref:Uncharacterized protein n=1 Tax=Pisolithus microcarpus 441 TaxID=765257 RepID=A0A0C9Z8C3_9AGAM|nr:hypothetical protein BKA83DRAFT_11760 [Pisolithus microcarpus]KIK22299.1 hypothetical protein PISMIDRAFT_11760 [Pisolithus microcarpus 441]